MIIFSLFYFYLTQYIIFSTISYICNEYIPFFHLLCSRVILAHRNNLLASLLYTLFLLSRDILDKTLHITYLANNKRLNFQNEMQTKGYFYGLYEAEEINQNNPIFGGLGSKCILSTISI